MRRAMTVALVALLVACNGGRETRTFELQHMDPDEAHLMLEPYVPGGGDNMRLTREPAALTITAPKVRLEQVAQVLQTYDRARPDVQLRFQLIEADGFTDSDPGIADVQQALEQLFRFRGYRLVAEAVAQAKAPGTLRQRMAGNEGRTYYIAAVLERVISTEAGSAVELTIELGGEGGDMRGGNLLATSLTVPAGQTVVVGSARAQADGNTLILVVRPQIR
jgi:hypothetical protein